MRAIAWKPTRPSTSDVATERLRLLLDSSSPQEESTVDVGDFQSEVEDEPRASVTDRLREVVDRSVGGATQASRKIAAT